MLCIIAISSLHWLLLQALHLVLPKVSRLTPFPQSGTFLVVNNFLFRVPPSVPMLCLLWLKKQPCEKPRQGSSFSCEACQQLHVSQTIVTCRASDPLQLRREMAALACFFFWRRVMPWRQILCWPTTNPPAPTLSPGAYPLALLLWTGYQMQCCCVSIAWACLVYVHVCVCTCVSVIVQLSRYGMHVRMCRQAISASFLLSIH